jgi:two-component system chemotaxis response regulator CheB
VVVDDSALFRALIRDALRKIPGASVVGNAGDGNRALEKIAALDPDVVTLDVEMPDKNGIQVLREMKTRGDRARVIMVSRHTAVGAQITTDALMEGAFDFVLKPSGSSADTNRAKLRDALGSIMAAVRESYLDSVGVPSADETSETAAATGTSSRCELVLIGSSTGGPDALRQILPALPASFRSPVLVVQHMPAKYTASLANRLNEICSLEVAEAADGDPIRPGRILIAPGGRQMGMAIVKGALVVRLTDDPPEKGCRPSVDYLFRSAFEAAPQKRMLGVILTGMGSDGADGCALLKDCGGRIVAQHAQGCVVYGMPKSVIDRGLADRVIHLDRIAAAFCGEAR